MPPIRRIVLDDEEICAVIPEAAKVPHSQLCFCEECVETREWNKRHDEHVRWLEDNPALKYGELLVAQIEEKVQTLERTLPENQVRAVHSMQSAFLRLNQLASKDLRCEACGSSRGFDSNFETSTIRCLNCNRVVSFGIFFQEQE